MKKIFLLLLLVGCASTHELLPAGPQMSKGKSHKYSAGDCVRFNKQEMKKQGKKTDGTPMFVLGFQREPLPIRYVVVIKHPRLDQPVQFTAMIKVFDRDTDKIECPK